LGQRNGGRETQQGGTQKCRSDHRFFSSWLI
jgi:hypothetical protein